MIVPAMGDRYLTGRMADIYAAIDGLGWISGSYANWMASSASPEPGDIDIFCRNGSEADHAQMCTNLLQTGFNDVGQTNFSRAFLDTHEEILKLVQVVYPVPISIPDVDPDSPPYEVRRYGSTPEELVANFDLSVAQAVVVSPTEVWVSDAWRNTNITRKLTVTDTLTPLNTVQRLIKYCGRGYSIDRDELAQLFNAWETMSDIEREVQFYL